MDFTEWECSMRTIHCTSWSSASCTTEWELVWTKLAWISKEHTLFCRDRVCTYMRDRNTPEYILRFTQFHFVKATSAIRIKVHFNHHWGGGGVNSIYFIPRLNSIGLNIVSEARSPHFKSRTTSVAAKYSCPNTFSIPPFSISTNLWIIQLMRVLLHSGWTDVYLAHRRKWQRRREGSDRLECKSSWEVIYIKHTRVLYYCFYNIYVQLSRRTAILVHDSM